MRNFKFIKLKNKIFFISNAKSSKIVNYLRKNYEREDQEVLILLKNSILAYLGIDLGSNKLKDIYNNWMLKPEVTEIVQARLLISGGKVIGERMTGAEASDLKPDINTGSHELLMTPEEEDKNAGVVRDSNGNVMSEVTNG